MKRFIAVISLLMLLGAVITLPSHKSQAEPLNIIQDKKIEDACTGNETAGHCADKPLIVPEQPKVAPDPTPVPESLRFGK